MNPLILAVIVCAMALSQSMSAQSKCVVPEQLDLSSEATKAYAALEKEPMFALGGIGYSGEIPDGEKAMRALLSERPGIEVFYKLATTDAGAGGIYGLLVLKALKSECFQSALKLFNKLPEKGEMKGRHEILKPGEVGFMSGCLYWIQNRKEIADDISKGKYDFWSNILKYHQPMDNWRDVVKLRRFAEAEPPMLAETDPIEGKYGDNTVARAEFYEAWGDATAEPMDAIDHYNQADFYFSIFASWSTGGGEETARMQDVDRVQSKVRNVRKEL